MNSGEIPIDEWLQHAERTMAEIAGSILGSRLDRAQNNYMTPQGLPGAYVAVMTPSAGTIQVGILSTEDGCSAFAKAILSVDSEKDISNDEVSDALSEMLNILAGGIKGRLDRAGIRATIGFPCLSDDVLADILMLAEAQIAFLQVRIDSIDALLLIASSGATNTKVFHFRG